MKFSCISDSWERASQLVLRNTKPRFQRGTKGSRSGQWRMVWASMCAAVIKDFTVLSFLYLCFQGVKSFSGHWNGVSAAQRANMWEEPVQACENQPYLSNTGTNFTSVKTFILKHSAWSRGTKLGLQKGPEALWAHCHPGLSSQRKKSLFWGRARWSDVIKWSLWGQGCGLKRDVKVAVIPLAKKGSPGRRHWTGLKWITSSLENGSEALAPSEQGCSQGNHQKCKPRFTCTHVYRSICFSMKLKQSVSSILWEGGRQNVL